MAQAHCQNEDCGHDWRLQKPPGEYKNGIRCPDCGTTRVEVATPSPQGQGGQQQPAQGQPAPQGQPAQGQQQGGHQNTPAPAPQQGQQQGGVPARQREMAVPEANTPGGQVAQIALTAMDEDANTDMKRQAVQGLGGLALDAIDYGMQFMQNKEQQKRQVAQNAEIQGRADYPTCPDCEAQMTEEDVDVSRETITCPQCSVVWEYTIQ